ncbi:MAG: A/G-specific adenine glycosylase [Pirellulales bacterium]
MTRKLPAPQGPCELPTPEWKRSLARRLLAWYRRHRRDLPWRRTSDPYKIWVSEIMLQQTQVATVVPYFNRFVAAFPTARALAEADEHDVLRLWEGLGYYRRARQLHRAARLIVDEHGGEFPRDPAQVGRLPGIGRYTAGAIVSIAYDLPAPILEANTTRLLSRLVAFSGDSSTNRARKFLWEMAESLVPRRQCGLFNQSLMELGSLVCTPKAPTCGVCPVRELCAAFRLGLQAQIPRARSKPPSEAVREASVAAWHGGKVFVRKRADGERWAGLWDFLRFPICARRGEALRAELAQKVRRQSGLSIGEIEKIATLKHGVTRFRITLDCYRATCRGTKSTLPVGQCRWIEPDALEQLPLSVTGRKLSRMLNGTL